MAVRPLQVSTVRLGVVLWVLWVVWETLNGSPVTAGWLAAVGVLACLSWAFGRGVPVLPPAFALVAALAVALTAPDGTFARAPLGGPFGYANATASFFLMAGFAGVLLAVSTRGIPLRLLGIAAAMACFAVPFLVGSLAGGVAALALVAVVIGRRAPRAAAVTMAAVAGSAVLAAVVLGATYSPARSGPLDAAVDATLSERRPLLWHDALVIAADHPVTGAGRGSFSRLSPTARGDADALHAHNELLERTAETGLVGGILALGLVALGFAVLARGGIAGAVGASALAALVVHSSIDYVLHFPAVGLMAVVVIAGAHGVSAGLSQHTAATGEG